MNESVSATNTDRGPLRRFIDYLIHGPEVPLDRQPPLRPGPYVHSRQQELDAEKRWRRRNAEVKAAGYKCGLPATVVQRWGGTTGSVPMETWSCVEHAGVQSWVSRLDGKMYPAGFTAGPIGGPMVDYDPTGRPLSDDGPRYGSEYLM